MKDLLADRTQLIDASGIRKVFALAANLKDPINFSIGQPDFEVPQQVKEAAVKAIESGLNKYSQTTGQKALLEKVQSELKSDFGWDDPALLITSGVSGALQLAFMATINPGDEVIVTDPYFVIYKHVVHMLGGKCVYVDTYPDFKIKADKLENAISDKTKMLIVNSPNNPTGSVYTDTEIQAIAAVAKKHDLLVMTDEIYDKFSYDDKHVSIAKYHEKTLLLKGFSKTYAMTGWRLAYAAGQEAVKPVIEEMTKIQQYTFVCAPTPFQIAGVAAMDTDITSHVQQYRQKRDMIYDGLKDCYDVTKPGGAFYMFVKAPEWAGTGTEFVKKAIENNMLVIPGNVFSEQDTHFRISYATTEETIKKGIDVLQKLAKS